MFESLDFDNGKSLQLRSTIGHIDDFALQEIVSVKFTEDLTRIGDVDVIDLKIDPSVSHILGLLSGAPLGAGSHKALSIDHARVRQSIP